MQPNEKSWWYVYGPGRSGTSYFSRLFASSAERLVSDWGLGPMLSTSERIPRLNQSAFLSNLYANIYSNAHHGYGTSVGLIFKQANSSLNEFMRLNEMFGSPDRIVFMLREPSSYVASATKKFTEHSVDHLSNTYLRSLNLYANVGGDVICYRPDLSKQNVSDYLDEIGFLRTKKTNEIIGNYSYRGEPADHLVTDEMKSAFSNFIGDNSALGRSLAQKNYVVEDRSPESS